MFELRGILPRIYREVKRKEGFTGEIVKRKAQVKYDRRKSRWNREKFAKLWPYLRRGWFYYLKKGLG